MKETIHNLYLFIQDENISEIGVQTYELDGTDEEKLNYLKSRVALDYKKSKRFKLPKKYLQKDSSNLPYRRYFAMHRKGIHLDLFEDIFNHYNSPKAPLTIITPIVNGSPKIDLEINHAPLQGNNIPEKMKQKGIKMEDYLYKYTTNDSFDLPRLLNDDYFLAIKLLLNEGYYVSACKLLLSFIDTIAFLAYGDLGNQSVIKKWLDEYAELSSIGITSSELVELRHSLLHMTNLDSRRVLKGNVKRLMFYVGTLPDEIPKENDEAKYFNLKDLIYLIPNALEKWTIHLNSKPSDLIALIERYDLIVSDSRKSVF